MTRPNFLRDLLAGFDAGQPDALLLEVADHADDGRVVIDCRPRRGNHGRFLVKWRHADENRTAEASTLAATLRAAQRQTRGQSAEIRP